MAATWSSDHSTINRILYLRLAIVNNISLAIGATKIDSKVILMQLGYKFNSYNLMHNLWRPTLKQGWLVLTRIHMSCQHRSIEA
jgi:hypothetical protein